MAKFNVGDKVRIKTAPDFWPDCSEFKFIGAEGTVGCWVDWPEAMDPYNEYIYVWLDKVRDDAKEYEGVAMLFHDHTLEKM